MSDSSHRGAFVFGLILGAASGALAALLMTPKSGQEIREQIKGQTSPVQERLSSATSGMRDRTSGMQDRLTTATSGVRERADGVIGASKEKVAQMAQRGQDATDQVVNTDKSDAAQATAPEPHATPQSSDSAPVAESVEHPGQASPGTE
jgi:gas vesicle protein